MFYLTNRDYATLIMDTGTILMILGVIILLFRYGEKGRPDLNSFLMLLILTIVMAAGDMLGYLSDQKMFPHSRMLATLGMTVFYAGFLLAAVSWLHYCRVRFKHEGLSGRTRFAFEYLPGMIGTALVLINIFTGWIFHYDETVTYHRGVLFIPMYVAFAIFLLAGFLCLARCRDHSRGGILIPLCICALTMIFGISFTFLVSNSASFAPIGIAMCFVFTHMGIMNEV